MLGEGCVPSSLDSGVQYRCVSLMGPLWFMRKGRRFGVHFLGAVTWRDNILSTNSRRDVKFKAREGSLGIVESRVLGDALTRRVVHGRIPCWG